MLQLIPLLGVVLLNLIVVYYVWRERRRTQSGMYLAVNAATLIAWACVAGYADKTDVSLAYWRVSAAVTALIPANLLCFALTRERKPVHDPKRILTIVALFAPALVAPLVQDFESAMGSMQGRGYFHPSWNIFWNAEGGLALGLNGLYLASAIFALSVRYNTAQHGPDRNLPRHLILSVAGPMLFGLLFATLSSSANRVTLIPSPTIVMVVTAQLGVLAVIRQEDVLRPIYLSKWIYWSIIGLIGFSISVIAFGLYESLSGRVLLTPAVHLIIAVTMILALTAGSLPPVQSLFDRVMFSRAWEYRQLVREAQKELFETRQLLRQAERLSVIGEMAARIAHEIKNPLGPIKGYTQMMLEKLEGMDDFPQRESFRRKLEIIAEEVENIDRRVRHLLDLARKPAVKMQPEDPNKMVNRAAILLRLEAESLKEDRTKSAELILVNEDLDPDLPEIECSRALIEEALFNLCRNAFEALEGRGSISLRTRTRDSSPGEPGIEIVVEDDGPGISDAALGHLYEPFFTEKQGGTGLGLSIVRSHIELHRGTVRFERGRAGGTVVTVWLPAVPGVDQTESGTLIAAGVASPAEPVTPG